LKGVKNIQYIGMASDEAHRVLTGAMQEPNKRTPLIEWGMTEAVCLAYCKKRGFDWGGLYDHFVRVSCFCCPLQRIGELRQLRRYFPVLWTKMLRWDDKMERAGMGIVYRRFKGDTTIHDWERRFAHEQLGFDLFNKK